MPTAQTMSMMTPASTGKPVAAGAATGTTPAAAKPATAPAATSPASFVPSAKQMRYAKVALMRFGLGPKTGTFHEFVSSTDPDIAKKLCVAELDNYAEYIRQKDAYDQQARSGRAFRGSQLTNEQLAEFGAGIVPYINHPKDGRRELNFENACRYGQHECGDVFQAELSYRIAMGVRPKVGFVERLVRFWSNHFSIYNEKSTFVRSTVGHYERAVIRRHVLGNFSDMLVETVKHPAMLQYLDNQKSGGMSKATDTSPARALANQNLAREILELHTMGTGKRIGQSLAYDQSDVEALAMMLTGWNINYDGWNKTKEPNWKQTYPNFGQPMFNDKAHHEGTYVMMGKSYSGTGQKKAIDALRDLAALNSTSLFLSTKLLKHFVTDNPSMSMVLNLNHHFYTSKGNLLVVAKALLNMQEAWDVGFNRIRPPSLWMTSMCRALNFSPRDYVNAHEWESRVKPLRNGTWDWITPDGVPDKDAAWVEPNAMRVRSSVAMQILYDAEGRRMKDPSLPAVPTADELYAGTLPWVQKPWLARGEKYSNYQTISALFLSPDYMTR